MNQKDGVYAAVVAVLGGEINGAVSLTDAQETEVHTLVIAAFMRGEIEYKGGCPDAVKLKKYVPGLVNNWLRKDTRLTAGEKYVTKKPGSRAGSTDESLKAMRILRTTTTDANQLALIDAAIEARQQELKPVKVINVEALPPQLRKFVQA